MLPAVYLKKDVLFIMILAAIETFRKECTGILFGYKPASERNYYIVTNAIAIQDVKSRTNNGVEQRKRSARKINAIFEKAPELYPKIGEFHSHPEGKKKIKNPLKFHEMGEISEADKKAMDREKQEIEIIVTLSSEKKLIDDWQGNNIEDEGCIEGRLGKYNFYITAYVSTKENGEEIKRIRIFAPEGISALNYAQRKMEEKKKK